MYLMIGGHLQTESYPHLLLLVLHYGWTEGLREMQLLIYSLLAETLRIVIEVGRIEIVVDDGGVGVRGHRTPVPAEPTALDHGAGQGRAKEAEKRGPRLIGRDASGGVDRLFAGEEEEELA